MIWHDGRVVPRESLSIPVSDRVFEHGLGLFETFRTWNGRAPLVDRHLARLRDSARVLGIDLQAATLPDRDDVESFARAASGVDVVLRLTLTAGPPAVAWVDARPLPAPEPRPLLIWVDPNPVGAFDADVHRHKMLNYWSRRLAHERAEAEGFDETLLLGPSGTVLEGSRNAVLFVPSGRSDTLAWIDDPLALTSVMGRHALDFAGTLGYTVISASPTVDDLRGAEAVFLANSARGVREVGAIQWRLVGTGRAAELVRVLTRQLPAELAGMIPA